MLTGLDSYIPTEPFVADEGPAHQSKIWELLGNYEKSNLLYPGKCKHTAEIAEDAEKSKRIEARVIGARRSLSRKLDLNYSLN